MPEKPLKSSTALTRDERDQFTRCEANIERGLTAVGQALKTIRDNRLYRETHDAFEHYCRERWGKSKSWVYYQIAAAIFIENNPEADIRNERQARAATRGESSTMVADKGHSAAAPAKPTKADRYREQIRALAEMDREALDQATRQSISDLAKTMAKREKVNLHSKEGKPLRDEYEQRVLVKLAPNARIALDQLAARPTLGAAQAYVGVIGSIQKGQVRGDTNHPDNFHAGLKKLANSGPHWESFDKEDREDFVRMWVALRDVMPEAFWVDLEKFSPAKKGGLS